MNLPFVVKKNKNKLETMSQISQDNACSKAFLWKAASFSSLFTSASAKFFQKNRLKGDKQRVGYTKDTEMNTQRAKSPAVYEGSR